MSYRNPEQAYIQEHTRHEAPLSSREEAVVGLLSRRRLAERRPERLPTGELLGVRSPKSDPYTSEEISRDMRWLASDKQNRRDEKSERAHLLESITVTDGSSFGWFGNPETTRIIGTTEYDDRHNFVDAVISYQRKDGSVSYLAIDLIAARSDAESLSSKRVADERRIINNDPYSVKYLPENVEGGQPLVRRINNLPRVVVGMDPSSITALSEHLYAYYHPEVALQELRDRLGLKAYHKDYPQNPPAMKEYARQQLANRPEAYDIAQEAYAQLGSQALLAFNVFLDRANKLLHEERPELVPFVEKFAVLELAVAEFRAHLNADPAEVGREETVAALQNAYKQLAEYEALEKATGYPVREVIRPLLPFVKHFGKLATQKQTLADPEKEDPTVKILARPWESDQLTRRQLAAV
ncbi:MAG: hypothetical protein WC734_03450 [Patescibacteria group bacterium]|jgi:hypothetical protein